MSIEQNLLLEVQRAAVRFPTELSTLLGITEVQLKDAIKVIPKQSKPQLIRKLTSAMHFNEKLAESAMGADATLHQYIENELNDVINIIK